MKTFLTATIVLLGFFAGVLEVKQNPQRYPSFHSMGPK
jgi:hypothetical protein